MDEVVSFAAYSRMWAKKKFEPTLELLTAQARGMHKILLSQRMGEDFQRRLVDREGLVAKRLPPVITNLLDGWKSETFCVLTPEQMDRFEGHQFAREDGFGDLFTALLDEHAGDTGEGHLADPAFEDVMDRAGRRFQLGIEQREALRADFLLAELPSTPGEALKKHVSFCPVEYPEWLAVPNVGQFVAEARTGILDSLPPGNVLEAVVVVGRPREGGFIPELRVISSLLPFTGEEQAAAIRETREDHACAHCPLRGGRMIEMDLSEAPPMIRGFLEQMFG